MTHQSRWTICLGAALAFSAAACGVKPPITPQADPYDASQIHMSSDELRNETAVGTPLVKRDDVSNLLFVTIPIRAATNLKLYIDYRVTFFDINRSVINQTTWFTKTLEPNVPDSITVNSTSPRAADFQVDFRLADQ
jgi:hypothetical protein